MSSILPVPLAKYAPFRAASGGTLYSIAGQGCRDPLTNACAGLVRDHAGKIIDYDITLQTQGVFANVDRALVGAGLTKADIFDVTVFLCSMDDFAAMNSEWDAYFIDLKETPTRTTVAVSGLPGDNFIEMKVLAYK